MKQVTRTVLIIAIMPVMLMAEEANYADTNAILYRHLTTELHDPSIAQELTSILMDDILNWKAPTIAISHIDSIVAYAFGNRILPNGNRVPGPMNEALADLVIQLYEQTHAFVYAQWEIAEVIGDRIPAEKIAVINPTLDAQANVVYLSTAGVAAAVIKQCGDPQKLGTVAVVAFNDHLYRCIKMSRQSGIDAYAPLGYSMPNVYDPNSGQPWTRNRLTYVMTDIHARITHYFEKLGKQ